MLEYSEPEAYSEPCQISAIIWEAANDYNYFRNL